MRVLMCIHGLPRGGAEIFFIRLAQALRERHEVTLYIPCYASGDAGLRRRLDGLRVVAVPGFTAWGYRVFYKVKQMLVTRFPGLDVEAALHQRVLRRLQRRHGFDVVNPHLMEASRFSCQAFRHSRLPLVESDHGHYAVVDAARPGAAQAVFDRLDALVCPSAANVALARTFPWKQGFRTFCIPYGYARPAQGSGGAVRAGGPFTFGLVARGVHYKGWREAMAAARLARRETARDFRLLLVGDGPAAREVLASVSAEERAWVEWAGEVDDPTPWIQRMNVGLLPTYLPGESLPNSIIEYLACGKPVIATPVGGIPEMLATAEGDAGLLVPRTAAGPAEVPALAAAMKRFLLEPGLYDTLAARTDAAFSRFDMGACVGAYEAAFSACMALPS